MNKNDSWRVTEGGRLLSYGRHSDRPLEDDLLGALDLTELNLADQEPPLRDFVNVEGLDDLEWRNQSLEIFLRAWDYPVLITADHIHIYSLDAL